MWGHTYVSEENAIFWYHDTNHANFQRNISGDTSLGSGYASNFETSHNWEDILLKIGMGSAFLLENDGLSDM